MHNFSSSPSDQSLVKSLEVIQKAQPNTIPKVGIILGSGAGFIANEIQHASVIPYTELPGLKACTVEGHSGSLYLGTIKEVPVACFQGRNHLYEGNPAQVVYAPVRLLKLLGAKTVVIISAVGSLAPSMDVGSLVAVNDHINFQFSNPLVGPNDEFWGPRFPSLENAYDSEFRLRLAKIAQDMSIPFQEGIYFGVSGPSFETPAEIRAFRMLGADVIGMSTIPEVIVARHCGLKVVVLCIVVNKAVGISEVTVDHQQSMHITQNTEHNLSRLLQQFIVETFGN